MANVLNFVPELTRVRVASGATLSLLVELSTDANTPVELTGATITSSIFARAGAAPTVTEFTIGTPTDGHFVCTLSAVDTAAIPGSWGMTVWVTLSTETYCVVRGDLEVVNV